MQRYHAQSGQRKDKPVWPTRAVVRWSRGGATSALLVGLAAALTLVGVILLYQRRPDLYDPARSALVEADLHLVRSYNHQQELLQHFRDGRRELSKALTFLEQAAHAQPALQAQIEPLRIRLHRLEQDTASGRLGIQELHHSYQELLARIEALIRSRP
jgi:hypothetical protein